MAKFVNTFSQGMDQDSSKNKYDNSHYYEAINFRVITQNSLSSGALENLSGNLRRLLTTVSAVDNFVVGSVVLRDSLIIWTTTNNTSTPDVNSVDKIWKVPLSSIENLAGSNALTLNGGWYHVTPATNNLIYSGHMNLCTGNKIKAVSRYESETVQKVYWIDGYNRLRHLNTVYNVEFNNLPNLTLDKLEVISNFELTRPEFTGIRSGNLKSGRVQYVYQLYTLNGGETIFSPASHLINLTEANDFNSSTINYEGAALDTNTGKAIIGSIDVQATGYHRIRIVAIHYSTLEGDPIIRVIDEKPISSEGETISFIDSGQSLINYTLEEIRLYGTYIFIPKEIGVKDNILFPANIKEDSFDITFDARAYRFAGVSAVGTDPNFQTTAGLRRKCKIFDQDGNYYLGDGSNPTGTWLYYNSSDVAVPASNVTGWSNIPETFDAINKFNDTDNDGNHAYRFMYQKDGATVGGEGPNVRYTFKIKTIELDAHTSVADVSTGLENTVDNPSYNNYASPYMCAKYLGYARDEVYRFGIVFFDEKGRASFVKWIGDIRTPSISTLTNVDTYTSSAAGNWQITTMDTHNTYDNYDYVKYEVIIDNDPVKSSSSYVTFNSNSLEITIGAIVAALTQTGANILITSDATKVYVEFHDIGTHTIILNVYHGRNIGDFMNEIIEWDDAPTASSITLSNTQEYSSGAGAKKDFSTVFYGLDGKIKANILYPEFTVSLTGTAAEGLQYQIVRVRRESNDRSIRAQGIVTGTYASTTDRYPQIWENASWSKDLVCLNSPEIAFNKNLDRQASDKLRVVGICESSDASASNGVYRRKYRNVAALANPQKTSGTAADGDEFYSHNNANVTLGNVVSMDNTLELIIGNFTYKRIMRDGASDPKCDKGTCFAALVDNANWKAFDNAATTRSLVEYRRNVHLYQYGGPGYGSRTRSYYMATGRVQSLDTAIIPVFDGDTYISMFDYLHGGWKEGETGARSEVSIFPVETSINLDLRMDTCYHNSYAAYPTTVKLLRESKGIHYDGTLPTPLEFIQGDDMYTYNTVYSKENTTKIHMSRPYDWVEQKVFDTRIIASSQKINNEFSDSWLKFAVNSYLDVDPQYGELVTLINSGNQMMFFQPKAFGVLSINERALIQTASISQLTLGTSGVLAAFQYAKTTMGVSYRDHIILTINGLYWLDIINKTMFRYTNGVEDIAFMKGMNSWFRSKFGGSITPSRILLYYDPMYKEVGLVDSVQNFNLVYNEAIDAFSSFYTFYPRTIITYNDRVLSSVDGLSFYKHNDSAASPCRFYGGAASASSITPLVNPAESNSCIFTNLEWSTEVYDAANLTNNMPLETFTKLRITNDYQDTGDVTLTVGTMVKRRIRRWRHTIGRATLDETGAPMSRLDARIRDSYIRLKLEFNNTAARRFVAHDITTSFMIANK